MNDTTLLELSARVSLLAPLLLPGVALWYVAAFLRRRRLERGLGARGLGQRAVLALALLLIIPGGVGFSAGATKVFAAARAKAHAAQCVSNVRGLTRALMMYLQDWDETYPPAENWSDGAARYLQPTEAKSLFRCPAATSPYGYAFNTALGRMPLPRLEAPPETVMLLESDATLRNATGDRGARAVPPRHAGAAIYGFADGHARWANPYAEARFRWEVPPAE